MVKAFSGTVICPSLKKRVQKPQQDGLKLRKNQHGNQIY